MRALIAYIKDKMISRFDDNDIKTGSMRYERDTSEDALYIDTPEALAEWVEVLRGASVIAVDTESDSFHHYEERVCLIQMTAQGKDVIIDPLSIDDISALGEFFENSRVIKIFHDAGYDLICLHRDFGFRFAGLFDTMLASRLIGRKRFGLASLLQDYFEFTTDKSLQRSDWTKRPLSEKQQRYARYDTHFLHDLMHILADELIKVERYEWAVEEFARIPGLMRQLNRPAAHDPEGFWRLRGLGKLSDDELGRVAALYKSRDAIARRLDRPPFKVMSNELLVKLAVENPQRIAQLKPRPGLRQAGIERFGKELIQALVSAKPLTTDRKEERRRRRSGRFLDPSSRKRFEKLRAMRKSIAETMELEPDVLMSNATLEDLALSPPLDADALRARDDIAGWREPIFVDPILETLS